MKKLFFFTLLSLSGVSCVFAQNVGIGTANPHSSAQLDISSNSKGILIPTMTAAQRSGIATPATGLLVFQTDGTPGFCYYNGTGWISLGNGQPLNSQGVSLSYGVTTTLAGSGVLGTNDGIGAAATFSHPAGIAADAFGNVYVADFIGNKIRKITPGGIVTTLAGSGTQGFANGTGGVAAFSNPYGLATDAAGNVYVADFYNNRIRKITPAGVVSTLAGSGSVGAADGPGNVASFYHPSGVAVDAAGNVYVADFDNHKIRKITPAGAVSTLAGDGNQGAVDGPSGAASFIRPAGVAVDPSGNVFVTDSGNDKVRKITPGGTVSTLAGSGNAGANDGTGTAASFNYPMGITIDAAGNLYVSDSQNQRIRKITQAGVVTTLAGSGVVGSADGAGVSASFNTPEGVTVGTAGMLYVGDASNYKIRSIAIY